MSLLTPDRVPVKVYKWDDIGAPVLNKSSGCMMNIFKSCLVTGYGAKEGAGWTAPFESTGVKVLRPEVSPHTDFYLRLSADTGTEMVAQVYLNMTDANTGDLKLQCGAAFKYAKGSTVVKWLLVATPRGLWFTTNDFHGTSVAGKTGAVFFAGDLQRDITGNRAVYIHHTGGTATSDYATITGIHAYGVSRDPRVYVSGKIMLASGDVFSVDPFSLSNGSASISSDSTVFPLLLKADNKIYVLTGMFVPLQGAEYNNFDLLNIGSSSGFFTVTVCASGTYTASNFYIATNEWVY